ncbi:MAG: hypothetical protein FWE27_05460 [Defluviitaleaceae bacterium]|nr:hypothetical protein [Defluviitaleaceae bacterium]
MPSFKHNGFDYSHYAQLPEDKLLKYVDRADWAFKLAFDELGIDINKYYIDFHSTIEALKRTDQRKLHYLMYHNSMEMNELKRIAVFSYWVLRFKPINRIVGGPPDINEKVVLSWIFSSIKKFRKETSIPHRVLSPRVRKDLLYALTYRDISYDYMTILVESLAE